MTVTDDIKNSALFELGWSTEVDFSGTSKTATTVNNQYEEQLELILSQYDWSFQLVTAQLSTATAVTDKQYNYSYPLPSTFARLSGVYYDARQTQPILSYLIDAENLLIYVDNSNKIFVKYITTESVTLSTNFKNYFKYDLASLFCMNLTGDKDLLQILEAKRERAKVLAFRIDGRGVKPKKIKSANKFLNVRG